MSRSNCSFSFQTKLMQGYRQEGKFDGGKRISLLRNQGISEILTIGNSGDVINIYQDYTSVTGYRSVSTKMMGELIATGNSSDGGCTVFASVGSQLSFVCRQKEEYVGTWSAPKNANLDNLKLHADDKITGISTYEIEGMLYVALQVMRKNASPDTPYFYAYCVDWTSSSNSFVPASFGNDAPSFHWIGMTSETVALTVVSPYKLISDQHYKFYTQNMKSREAYEHVAKTTVTPFKLGEMKAVTWKDQNNNEQFTFFNLLQFGKVVTSNNMGDWTEFFPDISEIKLDQLIARCDKSGKLHVFISSVKDGPLWHVWRDSQIDANGGWANPAPIDKNVAWLDFVIDRTGGIELLTIGRNSNEFKRMVCSEVGSLWNENMIKPSPLEAANEFESYSTDVAISDPDGITLANEPVKITCEANIQLIINGKVYMVGPDQPVTTPTRAGGGLTLVQPTQSLYAAPISISVPKYDSQLITLSQHDYIKDRLAKLTADELVAAKDAKGNNILPPKFASQASDVTKAINSLMNLKLAPQRRSLSAGLAGKSSSGLFDPPDDFSMQRIQINGKYKPWRLDFTDDGPVYRKLSKDEINDNNTSLTGILEWFGGIGDFFKGISNDIFKIVNIVTKAIDRGFEVAVTFIVEGVSKIFKHVVEFLSDAFLVVQMIFEKIGATFRAVFEFIGYIFNWKSILRTKEAVKHILITQFQFIPKVVEILRKKTAQFLSEIVKNIDSSFDELITKYGRESIGSVRDNAKKRESPKALEAMSNNFVLNHVLDMGPSDAKAEVSPELTSLKLVFENNEISDKWSESAKKYSEALSKDPTILQFPASLGETFNIKDFMNSTVELLLVACKSVSHAVLSGVAEIIDLSFALFEKALTAIETVLLAPIKIPVVSALYKSIAKSDLSIIDLVSLIVAIPANVFHGIIYGMAPFPDDAAVQKLKNEYTVDWMLSGSQLGEERVPSKNMIQLASNEVPAWAKTVKLMGAVVDMVGAMLDTAIVIIDAMAPGLSPKMLDIVSHVLTCLSFGCFCPWIGANTGGKNPWIEGPASSEGFGYYKWVFITMLNVGASTAFLIIGDKLEVVAKSVKPTVTFAIGLLGLILTAVTISEVDLPVPTIGATFATAAARMLAILGSPPLDAMTAHVSVTIMSITRPFAWGISAIFSVIGAIE